MAQALAGPRHLAFASLCALILPGLSIATAEEVARLYRSTQYLGRGDTGVSRCEEQECLFYNPAGLAATPDDQTFFKKGMILSPAFDLSKNAYDLSKSMKGSDDEKLVAIKDFVGKPVHIGVTNFSGAVFKDFSVGLLAAMRGNVLVYKDPYQGGLETFDVRLTQDMGLVGGYGYRFLDGSLAVGVSAKILQRTQTTVDLGLANADALANLKLADYQNKGTGFGTDIGTSYKLPMKLAGILEPQFALVIQDFGDTAFSQSKDNGIKVPTQRQSANIGASLAAPIPTGRVTVQLDMLDVTGNVQDKSTVKKLHMGADYMLGTWLGVSTGLNQGYPTTGLFLNSTYARLDLASYAEEVGETAGDKPDQRYAFRIVSQF